MSLWFRIGCWCRANLFLFPPMRVACRGKVTGENPAWWGWFRRLTVEFFENFLGGFDAVVLGLFEDGNAAEIGVGGEDWAIEAGQRARCFGDNPNDRWADQGVGSEHDINAVREL